MRFMNVHEKIRRKTSILKMQSMKIGGGLAKCSFSGSYMFSLDSLLFFCRRRVYGKPFLFEAFHAGCHVVLRGRRGAW